MNGGEGENWDEAMRGVRIQHIVIVIDNGIVIIIGNIGIVIRMAIISKRNKYSVRRKRSKAKVESRFVN